MLYQNSANQVISAHGVDALIPITGLSINWVYQGYNPNSGDASIDYSGNACCMAR